VFSKLAVTVAGATVFGGVVSRTLPPILCSRFLVSEHGRQHGRLYRAIERAFDGLVDAYRRALDVVLRHQFATLMVFFATVALTGVLFVVMPKGFFPTQDIA